MHRDECQVERDTWRFRVVIQNPSEYDTDGTWYYIYDADTGQRLHYTNLPLFPFWAARLAARRWIRKYVARQGKPRRQEWNVEVNRVKEQ